MDLPANFERDIQGRDTQLTPLVIIENSVSEEDIYISSKSETVKTLSYSTTDIVFQDKYYKPLLLNIPSITQSIDIDSRKFKVSSVTLKISNYERVVGEDRFSDSFKNTSMINKVVSIFWKSPSSKDVVPSKYQTIYETQGYIQDSLCPRVFVGKIRSVSHDMDEVTILIEDSTEEKHKDLPQVFTGTNEGIPEKYRNKPIPMVYGRVDKSPIVIDNSESSYTGVIDSSEILGLYKEEHEVFGDLPSVLLEKSDFVLNVPENIEYYYMEYYGDYNEDLDEPLINGEITGQLQWESLGNKVLFKDTPLLNSNFIQTKAIHKPTISMRKSDIYLQGHGGSEDNDGWFNDGILDGESLIFTDSDYELSSEIESAVEWMETSIDGQEFTNRQVFNINTNLGASVKEQVHESTAIDKMILPNFSIVIFPNGYLDPLITNHGANSDEFLLNTSWGNELFHFAGVDSNGDGTGGTVDRYWYDFVNFNQDEGEFANYNDNAPFQVNDISYEILTEQGNPLDYSVPFVAFRHHSQGFKIHLGHKFDSDDNYENQVVSLKNTTKIDIAEIDCLNYADVETPFENDIFVSTDGRLHDGSLAENPATIIRHILEEELGYTDFDEVDYNEAVAVHSDMKYAFTLYDKQINSRKLIEEIAKSTLMFPHFGNDGKFKFNTLKTYYFMDDLIDATVIKDSDVLSYKIGNTKPEKVYSKYKVDYHYDYAKKSFLKTVENNHEITEPEHFAYYGFEDGDVDANVFKLESKFIRDEDTADKINGLLFNLYKNHHLKINIKLPVKYIGLSVGDLIKFDQPLNNLKAFGEDYSSDNIIEGNQVAYSLFQVTSMRKNIDSVALEVVRLHEITYNPVSDGGGDGVGNGDINGDGIINILDVVGTVAYVLGNQELSEEQAQSADINSDGVVNILDVVGLVNIVLFGS